MWEVIGISTHGKQEMVGHELPNGDTVLDEFLFGANFSLLALVLWILALWASFSKFKFAMLWTTGDWLIRMEGN